VRAWRNNPLNFIVFTTHIPKLSTDVISSNDGSASGHGPITCQDIECGRLASTYKEEEG